MWTRVPRQHQPLLMFNDMNVHVTPRVQACFHWGEGRKLLGFRGGVFKLSYPNYPQPYTLTPKDNLKP